MRASHLCAASLSLPFFLFPFFFRHLLLHCHVLSWLVVCSFLLSFTWRYQYKLGIENRPRPCPLYVLSTWVVGYRAWERETNNETNPLTNIQDDRVWNNNKQRNNKQKRGIKERVSLFHWADDYWRGSGEIIPGRKKRRADIAFSFRDGLFRRHLEITKIRSVTENPQSLICTRHSGWKHKHTKRRYQLHPTRSQRGQ